MATKTTDTGTNQQGQSPVYIGKDTGLNDGRYVSGSGYIDPGDDDFEVMVQAQLVGVVVARRLRDSRREK